MRYLRGAFPGWRWEAEREANVFAYHGSRVALQGHELEHVEKVIVRSWGRYAYVNDAWMYRGKILDWDGKTL